jgi:hypothetical protein
MKKALILLLAVLTLTLTLALTSCGEGNQPSGNVGGGDNGSTNVPNHTHVYGEWSVAKEATCIEYGVEKRYCECGAADSRRIDLVAHSYGDWIITIKPTCTEEGLEESFCACGDSKSKNIAILEHSYDKVTIAKTPTCSEYGLKVFSCVCGAEDIMLLDMLPHDLIIDEAVPATCSSTGLSAGKHCGSCDFVIEQKVISKRPHTYDDKYDESCNKCGYIRNAECRHLNQELIPAKAPTCVESGLTEGKKCAKCDEIIVQQEVVNAKGHKKINGACSACGIIIYSTGLDFTSNKNNTCYVSGIGDCTDTFIVIPLTSPSGDVVTSIGDRAFANKPITGVMLSANISRIAITAFEGCSELATLKVVEENITFIEIDGNLYSENGDTLIKYAVGKKDE